MKNHKLSFLGFALVLLICSCKKNDIQPTNHPKNPAASVTKGSASGWIFLKNWHSSKNDSLTNYFSTISDTTITDDVAKAGLVMVYVKNGPQTQLLPFVDQTTNTYWYYQISKGSARINSENHNSDLDFKGNSFFYFVLTSKQLSDLQSEGKSIADLMQLSHSQVSDLLK